MTDNNHLFEDVTQPIKAQGWSEGGNVYIGDNSWIGTGAVLIGGRGLRIGCGCVVGANSVVTNDVPDFSVVVGNPAKLVRRFDQGTGEWRRVDPS